MKLPRKHQPEIWNAIVDGLLTAGLHIAVILLICVIIYCLAPPRL